MSPQEGTFPFDIARSIQWLMFDMICNLCLGKPLGFIEHHSDQYNFQQILEERLPIVEKFSVLTEVNGWLKVLAAIPFARRLLPSSKDKDGIGAIMGVGYIL